jgi:curved DNA-binding protein CbpA
VLLEVAPDASPSEIKRSYYKLARDKHPDRNPGDPHASEEFQALSKA